MIPAAGKRMKTHLRPPVVETPARAFSTTITDGGPTGRPTRGDCDRPNPGVAGGPVRHGGSAGSHGQPPVASRPVTIGFGFAEYTDPAASLSGPPASPLTGR